jgi:5-methylthioadenosine/S-adenosylhomocysteine deaminase
LTLLGEAKEREYAKSVLLSRSRFDAPANYSLRFYREYFKPDDEVEVHKERRRYHIRYGGTDFALNLDQVSVPDLSETHVEGSAASHGVFLEFKSRTWSAQDAKRKAELIGELLELLQIEDRGLVKQEYTDLVSEVGREA